jgi:simple sugar transport system ATP-binding protein
MTLLEVRNLAKRFGRVDAVSDISFSLEAGEAIGLIGDNGAGKSTLVKMLSGVHRPSSGTILLEGRSVRFSSPLAARASGVEIIHQDLALCADLDVASNIFLGRELRRRWGPLRFLDRKAMAKKAGEVMVALGSRVPPDRLVGEMSGGERQLVAAARALEFEPRVLLLDEPTAALSTDKIRVLMGLVEELKNRGVAIVLISHRFTDVLHVCDRVVVLRRGLVAGELVPKGESSERMMAKMHQMMTGAIG